jgi:hypothetical protein
MEYSGPGTYEFTFVVVMDGDSMADALEQARDFLLNQSYEPILTTCLEEGI